MHFFRKRPPVFSKIYDGWKMKRIANRLHKENEFAFIHCRSYVAAAAGLQLLKKHKIPFLFDMRGFWVDERVDNGQWNLKNPLFKIAYRLYKKKEKKYFEKAAHIISLTEKGKEELVNAYQLPAAKITVIPCCADLDHFDFHKIDLKAQQELKNKLGIKEDDKILSYLGSLGGWYLTNEMLDFFKVLKQYVPTAKFLFITHDSRESIVSKAEAKGIHAIDIIVEQATRQQVPLFLSLSNWSVFFIKDAYSKKASSPTKQGEIMAMGIPIVCNDIGDTGNIVKISDAGLVVQSFLEKDLKDAVNQLVRLNFSDKEKLRKAAFDFYDLNNGAQNYSGVYNNILK
ncbi:MAG: glycosyltransferase [Chitinophagaceae bacterium]